MNVFAKFDEIPLKILKVIKETKCYGNTHTHTVGRTDGRENSIPTHKHSLRGGIKTSHEILDIETINSISYVRNKL